jgi:general secretion pathway protein G
MRRWRGSPSIQGGAARERGFTLIELLIVIVILGVLAAIVVFSVGGVTDKGEESVCRTDERALEAAIEAYYSQEGEYPSSEADIAPGFLREESEYFDVGPGGVIAPAPGSDCT